MILYQRYIPTQNSESALLFQAKNRSCKNRSQEQNVPLAPATRFATQFLVHKRKVRLRNVRTPYQPPATLEAAGAAEGVREGGGGREVFLEGFALGGGWGLREEVDYLGDLGFCALG